MQILLVTKQVNLFLKNLRDFQGGWQLFEDSQIPRTVGNLQRRGGCPPNFQPPRQFTSKSVRFFEGAPPESNFNTETQNSEITRRQGREAPPEQKQARRASASKESFRPTTIDRKFTGEFYGIVWSDAEYSPALGMRDMPESPRLRAKSCDPASSSSVLALGAAKWCSGRTWQATYGLGIMWGMLIGLTLQFFINMGSGALCAHQR